MYYYDIPIHSEIEEIRLVEDTLFWVVRERGDGSLYLIGKFETRDDSINFVKDLKKGETKHKVYSNIYYVLRKRDRV